MRRILALALCLLLIPAALAETYVVDYTERENYMNFSLLLKEDGTLLTPTGAYTSIYGITPRDTPEAERLYSAASAQLDIDVPDGALEDVLYSMDYSRVALMDGSGRLLTGFDYSNLEYIDGRVVFSLPGEDWLTGAMDTSGNVIIEPVYAALKPLSGGNWLAMGMPEAEEAAYPMYIIDPDGNVCETGLHSGDRYFNVSDDGVATVWSVAEYDGKTVFIDETGLVLFGRGFDGADVFHGGYAVVRNGDDYGIIDRDGAFAVEPAYDYINHVDGKCYVATRGSGFAAYDEGDCSLLMRADFEGAESVNATPVMDDLLYVVVDHQSWLYTLDGERLRQIDEDKSVETYDIPDGAVNRMVEHYGEWPDDWARLIDLEGEAVSDSYRDIRSAYWRDGEGRYITMNYNTYTDVRGEESVDWDSYRYGLMDQDGGTLLPMVYDECYALGFDRYWVVQGDVRGMIDDAGKWYYSLSDYSVLMD